MVIASHSFYIYHNGGGKSAMRIRLISAGVLTLFTIVFVLFETSPITKNSWSTTPKDDEFLIHDASLPLWLRTPVAAKEGISPLDVYTFDCETTDRKPETLTNTCADFGTAIVGIKWKTWSATGAFGIGKFSINQCQPNCSEGKRVETPVSVQLYNLFFDGEKYYLNNATITPIDKHQTLLTKQEWDLGDFFRSMILYENQP